MRLLASVRIECFKAWLILLIEDHCVMAVIVGMVAISIVKVVWVKGGWGMVVAM